MSQGYVNKVVITSSIPGETEPALEVTFVQRYKDGNKQVEEQLKMFPAVIDAIQAVSVGTGQAAIS